MEEEELDESRHLLDISRSIDQSLADATLIEEGESSAKIITDISYGIGAFLETVKPVSVTMILASLAVNFISMNTSAEDGNDSGLEVYEINDDDGVSEASKVQMSLANALIIVCFIAFVTFTVVFLFWMGCLKCLTGYMIFSSGLLLGVLGGLMFYTLLQNFDILCDYFTFFFLLYNFAVVGILAIFYQKGVPKFVTQNYLILTSVILAWNLSRIEEYTCWALLVALAFYDLCAVLSPCGPLKALISVMEQRNETIPGMLYEADVTTRVGSDSESEHTVGDNRPIRISHSNTYSNGSIRAHTEATSYKAHSESLMSKEDGSEIGKAAEHKREDRRTGGARPDSESPTLNSLADCSPERTFERSVAIPSARNRPMPSIRMKSSVKLGLGDFVFYSVLVSRASMYGFAEFAACFIVVLSGLGVTLSLLTLLKIPLPALPISILLGVSMYFSTRFFISPFLERMNDIDSYV